LMVYRWKDFHYRVLLVCWLMGQLVAVGQVVKTAGYHACRSPLPHIAHPVAWVGWEAGWRARVTARVHPPGLNGGTTPCLITSWTEQF